MNELKAWCDMPKVEINGRKFVDMQILTDLLYKRFEEEKKNCESTDEAIAIAVCQNIIVNIS